MAINTLYMLQSYIKLMSFLKLSLDPRKHCLLRISDNESLINEECFSVFLKKKGQGLAL